IQEAEDKFRSIAESARDGIALVDGNLKIIFINNAVSHLIGYEPDELLGKSLTKILSLKGLEKELSPAVMLRFQKTGTGPLVGATREMQLISKNGDLIDVEVSINAVKIKGQWVANAVVRDIRERKAARLEIEKERDLAKKYFDSSAIITIAIDPDGKILQINTAGAQMLGLPQEKIIGKNWFTSFIPAGERQSIKELHKSILSGKKQMLGMYRNVILTDAGEEKTIDWRNTLLKDDQGADVSVLSSGIDITEQTKAEERYRTLYKSSRDAIMTLEPPSWKFTSGNDAAVELFGAKDEKDFCARAPWQYSPKTQPDGTASGPKAKQMIEQAMKSGSNFFEWTHRRVNGQDFPATVLLTRVSIGGNVFLQATVRDITDQIEAENELRTANVTNLTILEHSPFGIIVVEKDGSVSYANQAVVKISGDTREQIQSLNTFTLPSYQKLGIAKKIKEAFKGKSFYLPEINYVSYFSKKETIRNITGIPVVIAGEKKVLLTVKDVTEQKRAEKKANELDVLKSRFITALTHVTRTPLNEIRWGVETLISGDLGELTEEQNNFLRNILESGQNVASIVTNMNLVLDIERGTMVFEKTPTSIVSIATAVLAERQSDCQLKKITCQNTLSKTEFFTYFN
ncbi:MAG: PAS domain S-box protein, partial [Patescibacteria group bacterium]